MGVTFFADQLASKANQLAITDLQSQRSWKELDHNILALTHYLQESAAIKPGQHMALMIGNRIEYIEAMLAGMLAGLWVTPINTHLTASEVDYICTDCGATIVFYDDDHAHLLNPDSQATHLNITDIISQLPSATPTPQITPASPAGGNMLYTSGTTGKPKGVKRAKPATIDEMIRRMQGLGSAFGLKGRGPHLVTGPLYHAAPGMFAIYDMLNGAPVIIMPKWSCDVFFQAVREYRVVTTHLVPTMFIRLLDARDQGAKGIDLSSLEYVLHGAAPITPTVKQKVIDWWGPILTEYWGATESGVVTLVNSEEWISHPGTVGRAIDNFTVFVADENGNPIDEEEGLLFCRHKQLEQVFSYHNDPDKTQQAHPQPHVFSLGDIGRVNSDGFVYLSDRKSHMIISGGVNIYPTEIEQALMQHEHVADCAVFGIPNPEWGEEVKAVVELRNCTDTSADKVTELRDFLRTQIAGFKVPRSIDFVDQLPRNPSGKVLIRDLKEPYKKQTDSKS